MEKKVKRLVCVPKSKWKIVKAFNPIHQDRPGYMSIYIVDDKTITLPVGTEFEVSGKARKMLDQERKIDSKFWGKNSPGEVTIQPIKLPNGKEYYVRQSYILEQDNVSFPKVSIFALRNKATGKFFKPTMTDTYIPGKGYQWSMAEVDKLSAAKTHKQLNAAKASLMEIFGYNAEKHSNKYFHPDYIDMPEWLGGEPIWDFNSCPDFDLVEFDKVTKMEVGTHPWREWYGNLLRLRRLMDRWGKPVKDLYKKLEDKNKLSEFPVVLSIRPHEEPGNYNWWRDFTDKEQNEIDSILAGFKKNEYMKVSSKHAYAIAFSNMKNTVILKLKLQSNKDLDFTFINTKILEETVED